MKILKILFNRITLTVLALFIEVGAVIWLEMFLGYRFPVTMLLLRAVALLVVIQRTSVSRHVSFDMIWVVGALCLPVAVGILYFINNSELLKSRTYRALIRSEEESEKYYTYDDEVLSDISRRAPERKGQFAYINDDAGFPFYRNSSFEYYELGDLGYERMLEDIRSAEKFIFIEYFIIKEGKFWNGILDILEEKAAEGVDIRVLYDDLGSITTLNYGYARKLRKKGIKCYAFNRINVVLTAMMNHRDHRKILVVDGRVAYSGGINLSDEYINIGSKYGHWKDNVIRMEGLCVRSFTILFLSHFRAVVKTDEDCSVFLPEPREENTEYDGFIAPYGETPLDNELTSQNIYMNILYHAVDYCYIFTPYLIIDSEMINALILAAKRGVDVRIITPGVPDKKLVWKITRSYYHKLIEGGVRIFEYTPGFVHAKVFVSDDCTATVGTVNLDYRSLYLHFENGTYLFDSEKVSDIKGDFLETEKLSHEISIEESKSSLSERFIIAFARLFAPLI